MGNVKSWIPTRYHDVSRHCTGSNSHKFDIGVTLFASGLATVISLLGSGLKIPMYYGSSFAYIAAVGMVVGAKWGGIRSSSSWNSCDSFCLNHCRNNYSKSGESALDKVLPPIITGSVAIVIGISLTKAALDMAAANWTVAIVTLLPQYYFQYI
ncbi:MAG: solute carrier family 23 protein [Patescibacteria group bacterium]